MKLLLECKEVSPDLSNKDDQTLLMMADQKKDGLDTWEHGFQPVAQEVMG